MVYMVKTKNTKKRSPIIWNNEIILYLCCAFVSWKDIINNIKILCNMIMAKSLHSILQFTPISFMFLLLSSQPMYAQQWQLKGRLVEKVDRTTPLDAAEILVSPLGGDVTSSSLSDEEGRFALSLSSGKYVFRYRQLGDIL